METAVAARPVAVVGAGTMGSGIAQVFAASGRQVLLLDQDEAGLRRGMAAIERSLDRLAKKGTIDARAREETLRRVLGTASNEALVECALAIEAVPERVDLKKSIFRELDRAIPKDAILATNTSSISITELAAATSRAPRVVGMHFMNPVPVMQLVEIVRGLETSDETVRETSDLARALGKTPVVVEDRPGFVSNRVLMPMINEAAYALMEGVAAREAIDTVMKLGMNHPLGPLALADLIGLDVCLDIMEVLHRGFGDDKYRPCPLLRSMVAAGRLGRKSGRGFYEYPAS
ncbi:MAG: 3-hydroxybutyryl-CoA dehydrogenase [Candidatus Latescibacteria bacterium]|nr:3-hydroxybutyryl-CoA dehydrogenase [Candidatus Latescibacterota bacterium]